MTKEAVRLRAAILDPAAMYHSPEEVEHDAQLSREDKLAILKSWEEDAHELTVAEDENMAGGEPSRLDDVVAARGRLSSADETSAATRKPSPGAGTDPAKQRVRRFAKPVYQIIHADHEIDEVALQLSLQEHPVLPVSDGDQIVGAITCAELDEAAEAKRSGNPTGLTARVMMTTDLAFCYLDDDVATARALMEKHGCRYLMVVDRDRFLVGMLERDDLPAVSPHESRSARARPEVVEPREKQAQSMATTIQPGGLDVYAERPKLGAPKD